MKLIDGDISVSTTIKEDVDNIWDIISNPKIINNLTPDPLSITYDNFLNALAKTEIGTTSRIFSIKLEDSLVGVITLNNISHIKNSAFLGVVAVKSKKCGWIGYRACKLIANYCFNTLNLNRLYAHTWADNDRLGLLYKRVGCVHEGTEREHTWKNGSYVDLKIWGLLKREYGQTS